MSYNVNDIDVLAEYRRYRLPIRRFISGCLLQYLLEQKQVSSCYALASKFNKAMGMEEVCDSKYWNKILGGMVLSSMHKLKAIESFDEDATKLLCHPLCQILNLPTKYFVHSPINILLKKKSTELRKAETYLNHEMNVFSRNKSSRYICTLNNLCVPILKSYDASAAFQFEETLRQKSKIDAAIFDAKENWRYPQTVVILKNIIEKKLNFLNETNHQFAHRLK
jgi:hypothetical protein